MIASALLAGCASAGKVPPAEPSPEPTPAGADEGMWVSDEEPAVHERKVVAEPPVDHIQQAADPEPEDEGNCCRGLNECKGLGNCKTDGLNECAGMNECKGKGGCKGHCPN